MLSIPAEGGWQQPPFVYAGRSTTMACRNRTDSLLTP